MLIFLFSFIGLLCEELFLFAIIAVIFFCIENFSWILLGILGIIATVILISMITKLIYHIKYSIRGKREFKKKFKYIAWDNLKW